MVPAMLPSSCSLCLRCTPMAKVTLIHTRRQSSHTAVGKGLQLHMTQALRPMAILWCNARPDATLTCSPHPQPSPAHTIRSCSTAPMPLRPCHPQPAALTHPHHPLLPYRGVATLHRCPAPASCSLQVLHQIAAAESFLSTTRQGHHHHTTTTVLSPSKHYSNSQPPPPPPPFLHVPPLQVPATHRRSPPVTSMRAHQSTPQKRMCTLTHIHTHTTHLM